MGKPSPSRKDAVPAWERLYERGLIVAAKHHVAHVESMRRQELLQSEREGTEVDCTFHPRINLTSSMAAEWAEGDDGEAPFDRLYELARIQQQKKLLLHAEKESREMQIIEEERREALRWAREEHGISEPVSESHLTHLFNRLAKPVATRSSSQRSKEEYLRQRQHSFKPQLCKATDRLYAQAQRKREALMLKEKELKEAAKQLEEQEIKAKKTIRQRGGPSCLSGNSECQCPGHHHDKNSPRDPFSKQTRNQSPPEKERIPLGAAARQSEASAAKGKVPSAAVRGVSPRLLAIPAHRLQQQYWDAVNMGNSRSASSAVPPSSIAAQQQGNWASSPFFAHLAPFAPQQSTGPLVEPSSERLTLDDLARHELLVRSRLDGSP